MNRRANLIKLSLIYFVLTILTACGGGGGSSSKSENTTTSLNTRPIAIAGPDQVVDESQLVTLNGSTSYDPDGDSIAFQWRQISGNATVLTSESDDTPSFISPNGSQSLTFQLVTDDGTNLSMADTVTITVEANTSSEEDGQGNGSSDDSDDNQDTNAGGSGSDTDNTNSDSNDNDDPTNNNDNTTNDTEDNTNDSGPDSGSDSDQNSPTQPTNTAPVANAGEDQNTNGFSLVVLNGSASSDNESDAITYLWQQISGTPVTLNNALIASPNFDAPNNDEVLTFSLVVNDAQLASAVDEVNVIITKVNTAPTANAGSDKTVNGFDTVQLQGTASSDPENDSLSYQWLQTSGTSISLNDDQLATPSFIAPNQDDVLGFSLIVNDGEFNSIADNVTITIESTNTAPTSDAGLSQSVQGLETVILDGTNSMDPENNTLAYLWSQVSGTPITLIDPESATPGFTAPNLDEILTFSLTVNDGELNSLADTVIITVEKINTIPIANAGVDRFVGSQSVVALNGSLSNDLDDDPISFVWSQLSGPNVILSNINTAKPTFSANTDGQLIFSLVVNDGQNNSIADTVKVTVGPIPATNIKVNGTGITWGGSYPTGNNLGCIGEAVDQQDCSLGRELTHNDNSDGRVGFSFTKYDSNGVDVGNNASDWQCVQDSVTGLMWEVKTGGNDIIGDEGINDADDRYSWYNSDPASNGSGAGFINDQGAVCSDYDSENQASYCNTEAYVERMNKNAWCGFADWRLPTRKELISIVDYGNNRPMIDVDYFPAVGQYIWTSTPLALGSDSAWGVNFDYGNSFSIDKRNARQVRLVRGGYE